MSGPTRKRLPNTDDPEEPPESRWKVPAILGGVVVVFFALYYFGVGKPNSIDRHQSWLEQLIDARFIITLLRLSLVAIVFFITASLAKAVIDGRLLERFFWGAELAKARKSQKMGLNATEGWEDSDETLKDMEAKVDKARNDVALANSRRRRGDELIAQYEESLQDTQTTIDKLLSYIESLEKGRTTPRQPPHRTKKSERE